MKEYKQKYMKRILPWTLSLLLAVGYLAAPVFAVTDGEEPAASNGSATLLEETGGEAGQTAAPATDDGTGGPAEYPATDPASDPAVDPAGGDAGDGTTAPAEDTGEDPDPGLVDITAATVTGLGARTYTGSAITPEPVVTLGETVLVKDTDYTVAYANNVKVGTAKVTITGTGAYTGTLTQTFAIKSRTAKSLRWSGVDMVFKTAVQKDNALSSNAGVKRVWQTPYSRSQKLKWNKAKDLAAIDGYIILRRTGKGAYKEIKRVGKNTTTYTDKKAKKKNVWYGYVVVAYKKDGATLRIAPSSHWVGAVSTRSRKINVGKVKMNYSAITLDQGEPLKLKLKFKPNTWSKSTRWRSTNPAVASVSSKGVVKGLTAGTATIYGRTARGRDVKCTVTVTTKKYVPSKYQAEIRKYGKTFILVDISDQKMVFIKNGKTLVETPVVTGTLGSRDTPRGTFKVFSKMKDTWLTGPTWHNHVDYWMEFKSGGWGIHDAAWRKGKFGGSIYKTDGSHGCVNTPTQAMKIIYNNAPNGTKVVVRK